MTIDEARRILGLGPDEDAASHLEEFGAARERIAEMVRAAPNDTLALRYQEGLMEFDQALAAVREAGGDEGAREGLPPMPVDEPAPGSAPDSAPEVEEEAPGEAAVAPAKGGSKSRRAVLFALALIVVSCAAGGLWVYQRIQSDTALRVQARLVFLERQGALLVENRRWDEAGKVYSEIESIFPESSVAVRGRRSIEAGIEEEQKQFMAYWQGEALVSIGARRWDDAEKAVATIEERLPDSAAIGEIRKRLADGRLAEARELKLAEGRSALADGKWDIAIAAARELLEKAPDDEEAGDLLAAAENAAKRERENLARARELFTKAIEKHSGVFDEEALEWAREAARLAPGDEEIVALYRKLAAYTRTIELPGDYPTLAAALEAARPDDLIRLGEGTWNESLVINRPVRIEGVGGGKSVIECSAEDGPVITWDAGAVGGEVSGLEFRHQSFAPGSERFSVALVRGAQILFSDCVVRDSSGHGMAVIDGGVVSLIRCKFLGNGWDGVAVFGEGSRIEASACEASGNFEHGFDIWDGGSAAIRDSEATGNGRNGIFIHTPAELAVVSNRLHENREFGLVVGAAQRGVLRGNRVERNTLGGIALHRAARGIEIRDNVASRNKGPGLILDKGFSAAAFDGNQISGNRATRQIAKEVTLDAVHQAVPPKGMEKE